MRTMKLAQEKNCKYEEKISSLMNENQSLKIRAAVSFDELTPRPSFHEVSFLKINCFFFKIY